MIRTILLLLLATVPSCMSTSCISITNDDRDELERRASQGQDITIHLKNQ
jgi:hypothetical protein